LERLPKCLLAGDAQIVSLLVRNAIIHEKTFALYPDASFG
jgi:hypothetical protein